MCWDLLFFSLFGDNQLICYSIEILAKEHREPPSYVHQKSFFINKSDVTFSAISSVKHGIH